MRVKPTFLLLSLLTGMTGCVGTFREIKPLSFTAPPDPHPTSIVLAQVEVRDGRLSAPERAILENAFKLGVEKWCADEPGLTLIQSDEPATSATHSVRLVGVITEVEKGSSAERFWIGMGAGQARIQGDFEIQSADGKTFVSFHARKSYLGGAGIGGWDMMRMDELAGELGKLVAETTAKWCRGDPIE